MFHRSIGRRWLGWTVAGLALLIARVNWSAEPASPAAGKLRVLVITGGHAYEEPQFEAMFKSIPDIAVRYETYPKAAELLKPDLAKDTDVVVFYDMWAQGITPEQQKDYVALLKQGIGIVALHHTMGAHANWPEYEKIISGRFRVQDTVVDGKTVAKSGYDHDQDIDVKIADADHPITRGLKDFAIHDETYSNYDTSPDAHVLLTTKHPKSDPELAWVKTYERSRVFLLQLGHDHFAYENPTYRQLIARGIRWTAGRPTDPEAAATPLFNGKDLTGWKAEGKARWEVENGTLVGRQGENGTPGDLLTEQSYDDFELTVTFRMEWPGNSGVWYRYQSADKAYQADILEYKQPYALTGSLYCTGKMFIATNTEPKIVNREGWNTMVIRSVGQRQTIILNGKQVADVCDDTSNQGKIGFQVHQGDEFKAMRIIVREINLRKI
jgi:type 1 glutamine amidotransferase